MKTKNFARAAMDVAAQDSRSLLRPAYIFVDDGSPEASDYDSNYLGYDPATPGSYQQAAAEARRICSTATSGTRVANREQSKVKAATTRRGAGV
jgi:hypothetical protein